jgi:two-component system CheB/CheR fusion protein
MLGHELRNPLAPLATVGQILSMQDGGLEPERVEWAAKIIDRQVSQLSGLVDDLLDVARISEGRIELAPGRCELDELLTSAVESVAPLVERNHQDLEVCRPRGKVLLDVDKTRVVQVISNLLHNATKYTPEGGKIRLGAATEGDDILITVEDTGQGIDPGMLPYVFDLFRQSDTSLARPQGGLGLGLTLVRRLVEMHGGCVCATSDGPGKGSRFEVRLPVVYALEQPRSGEPGSQKSD